jgi:DNA (cytosine-5)-methyltransferase 1
MKVLNLYAGLGGNRKHWEEVEVTAVEMEEDIANVYRQNFPDDKVVIGDARQYLLDYGHDFDFIWTSPPCQTHSRMMKATRHKKKRFTDMSLYQEILFLQHFYKGKWVVENVKPYYEPLISPTAILGRHYFWGNFSISHFEVKNIPNFIQDDTVAGCQRLKDWLGIQYEGNIYYKGNHSPGQVLRNCVHPDLGLHILNCARNIITKKESKQQSIFQ